MTIRTATEADLPALERLWRAFLAEIPASPWVDVDEEAELREIADLVAREIAVVAEGDDGSPVGFALARRAGSRLGRLTDLYVAPEARRNGVASALVREAVSRLRELGLEFVRLEVMASNADARAVYAPLGLRRGRADAGGAARRARAAPGGGGGDASTGVGLRPDRRPRCGPAGRLGVRAPDPLAGEPCRRAA